MEEDFEEDWRVLRRKSVDRIPTTMSLGEAMTRISMALNNFLVLENDSDNRFFLAIEHQRQKDSYAKLNFKLTLNGFKDKENVQLFDSINKLPFCEELEVAVENTFNEIRRILVDFNQKRSVSVGEQQKVLQANKEVLMHLERNLAEMGLFDIRQKPLPFDDPS
jgi:hypothetical protein